MAGCSVLLVAEFGFKYTTDYYCGIPANMEPKIELTKKVIVIGDSGVGKTAFVARVSENRFISEYKATIGGKLFGR